MYTINIKHENIKYKNNRKIKKKLYQADSMKEQNFNQTYTLIISMYTKQTYINTQSIYNNQYIKTDIYGNKNIRKYIC